MKPPILSLNRPLHVTGHVVDRYVGRQPMQGSPVHLHSNLFPPAPLSSPGVNLLPSTAPPSLLNMTTRLPFEVTCPIVPYFPLQPMLEESLNSSDPTLKLPKLIFLLVPISIPTLPARVATALLPRIDKCNFPPRGTYTPPESRWLPGRLLYPTALTMVKPVRTGCLHLLRNIPTCLHPN